MKDRKEEFKALIKWLTARLKKESKMVAPNFILLGDLNLDLDNPPKDRPVIESYIRSLNKKTFGDANARHIYFPFIGNHPRTGKPIRTNARQNQTFDQIAFFLGKREKRLPNDTWWKETVKNKPDAFDYDVFNFADLFAKVIEGKPYDKLTKAEVKKLGRHFENSVSDHMPIWVRIPRPGFRTPPPI